MPLHHEPVQATDAEPDDYWNSLSWSEKYFGPLWLVSSCALAAIALFYFAGPTP